MTRKEPIILLVEDDDNDQIFIRRAFHRCGVPILIQSVGNGMEAMAYLRGTDSFSDRSAHPLPSLIITDLKMPKMGGLDLLAWLDRQDDLRTIVAVALTSSSDEADVAAAFRHGAKGYMIKPVHFAELEQLARTIAEYWRRSCIPCANQRLPAAATAFPFLNRRN
jgi:CheY-like chemotaxis protein